MMFMDNEGPFISIFIFYIYYFHDFVKVMVKIIKFYFLLAFSIFTIFFTSF